MHKLPITSAVRVEANKYAQRMLPDPVTKIIEYDFKSDVKRLLDQLKIGKAHVLKVDGKRKKEVLKGEQKPYEDYLQKILDEYPKLLACEPGSADWKRIDSEFGTLLNKDALKVSIRYPLKKPGKSKKKNRTETFHEAIVRMMGYTKIQKEIFPPIMERLHVKTCVYCNSQFAIVADDTTALFQLDHCWPKSVYPYLCTCFFNLQPSCGSCNQRKLDTDMRTGKDKEYTLSMWQCPDDPLKDDMFSFHIDDAELAKYLLSASAHKAEMLKLSYALRDNPTTGEVEMHKLVEQKFHITDQYNKQLDIVEETVWRHQIYSSGYIGSLNKALGKLFPDMKSEVRRLVTGTYDGKDEVYRRPLSKMIHDVNDQLDNIRKKKP